MLEQDREERLILTVRCRDDPEPMPGVTTRQCSQCGQDVWVSQATWRTIVERRWRPTFVCNECNKGHEAGQEIEPPSAETLAELAAALGLSQEDAAGVAELIVQSRRAGEP